MLGALARREPRPSNASVVLIPDCSPRWVSRGSEMSQEGHVDDDGVSGLVASGDQLHAEVMGSTTINGLPMRRESSLRYRQRPNPSRGPPRWHSSTRESCPSKNQSLAWCRNWRTAGC